MRRWVLAGVVVVLLLGVAGLVVTFIPKLRQVSDEVRCANNLREITQFAAHHAKPQPGTAADRLLHEVPAGTVVLPGIVPEDRLSWFVQVLPGLDQKRQNTAPLLKAIDRAQPWPAEKNQRAARLKLLT